MAEIKSQYGVFQLKKNKNNNKLESILESLYITLMDLEEEINLQYTDADVYVSKENQDTKETDDGATPDQMLMEEQMSPDDQ